MALSHHSTHPRRIGLRKENLGYGSLLQSGPHVKAKSREQKQRSPSTDIYAPPRDSSDEASIVHDVELSDTESLPSKKRRTGSYELAFKSTGSESPQSGSDNTTQELRNEPSRISSSSFSSTSSRFRRPHDSKASFTTPNHAVSAVPVDDVADPIHNWTVRSRKTKAMYGTNMKNIHTALPVVKKKKETGGANIPAVNKSKTGFRTFNSKAFEPLREWTGIFVLFQRVDISTVNKIDNETVGVALEAQPSRETTPRSKRASKRLSRNNQASSREGELPAFKQPSLPPSKDTTPPKGLKSQGFVVPLILSDGADTPNATRSSRGKPKSIQITGKSGANDLKDLVELSKDKLRLPDLQYRDPPSSVPASSIPSTSLNDDSSVSSFSSAPDTPKLEAIKEQFAFPELGNVTYYAPPSAKCPICREPVERAFLEEFHSGERLNIRQQARFCKAHKTRSAENEWQLKGYPEIDWPGLSERLGQLHSVADDILKGVRPSFYRNVFEDQIKSGQNRTLQQSLLSGRGFEALTPGYYGSKGSRLMYCSPALIDI